MQNKFEKFPACVALALRGGFMNSFYKFASVCLTINFPKGFGVEKKNKNILLSGIFRKKINGLFNTT
jgi:hypothetical protein